MKEHFLAAVVLVGWIATGMLTACGRSTETALVAPTITLHATSTPSQRTGTEKLSQATTVTPSVLPTRRPTPQGLPTQGALGDTWSRPVDHMIMLYVPGGTFRMGTDADDPMAQDDEGPAHTVTLSSFWIDRTEVTNGQYAACVAAGACQAPFEPMLERHKDYFIDQRFQDHPVIYVSWRHATDYCDWVGGALPSEAQWEYAARGPNSFVYPWGDGSPDDTLLNYNKAVNDPTAVGAYSAGASWCGALDMAGNVYEWVADWYHRYDTEPQTDPTGPETGIGHVLRGGSWFDGAGFVRAANRYVIREAYRDYTVPSGNGFLIGFRCAIGLG